MLFPDHIPREVFFWQKGRRRRSRLGCRHWRDWGCLSEGGLFPAVAALCVLSAFCGGLLCARRPLWGMLPSAMLPAALFAVVLLGVGLLCWEGIAWTGRGGARLLSALAGGLLAGQLTAAGKRRGKGRRRTRPL